MKRAELEVGGAYFHKSSQYGTGEVVIVLSDQPHVEEGWSYSRAQRNDYSPYRPARKSQYGRGWGSDNRNGVLVASAYLPYGGYLNATQPFDVTNLNWRCNIVQLRDIQVEVAPAGADFVDVMTKRAEASLAAHKQRIALDNERKRNIEATSVRCKDAIEAAGMEPSYTASEGRATFEVKYGQGRITVAVEDFERLAQWAGIGQASQRSDETRLSA